MTRTFRPCRTEYETPPGAGREHDHLAALTLRSNGSPLAGKDQIPACEDRNVGLHRRLTQTTTSLAP